MNRRDIEKAEKNLVKSIENDEWVRGGDASKLKKKLQKAAKNTMTKDPQKRFESARS